MTRIHHCISFTYLFNYRRNMLNVFFYHGSQDTPEVDGFAKLRDSVSGRSGLKNHTRARKTRPLASQDGL